MKRVDPDGLIAAALLSLLATAGIFYTNILPALVDGLRTGLGFSGQDAGFVSSANLYGAAFGALAAVFTVRHWPWRQVAMAALVIMIAIDLVSTQVKVAPLLIGIRFVHGLVGGFLVGTVFGVVARTRTPDRVFGMLLVVQYTLGGVGLMFLPKLVPVFGAQVLFLTLAGFSLAAALSLLVLPPYPLPARPAPAADGTLVRDAPVDWLPLIAALAAIFLFQAANNCISGFVIGLGKASGLSTDQVSNILAIGNWIGIGGAVLVIWLGIRFGRTTALMAGLAATIAGNALFLRSDVTAVFFAANTATSITWAFVIPYLLGLCSAFDVTGRTAAMGGLFSKLGLATGPMVGGILLQETHYDRLILAAVAALAVCMAAALWPALRLDRARVRAAPAAPVPPLAHPE